MTNEIQVLDKGFVRLIDSMGSDSRICEAARVSTQSQNKNDKNLLSYLIRNKHTSPFEFCEVTFHLKLPLFVLAQIIRHRTANVSQVSFRYTEAKEEYYLPSVERMQLQSTDNRQGSGGQLTSSVANNILYDMKDEQDDNSSAYGVYLRKGLTRELSRINLPVSIYTECYWKMDLHNLMHFLRLRLDDHAQFEIQEYAKAIYEILKELFPLTMEAFQIYTLNSITLSEKEKYIITELLKKNPEFLEEKKDLLSVSELIEFKNKFFLKKDI